MNKRILVLIGIFIILMMVKPSPTQGWIRDEYYVKEVSTAPIIDGTVDGSEWATDEDPFTDEISGLVFPSGSATNLKIKIVILRTDVSIFILVTLKTSLNDWEGNFSVGIALANSEITTMITSKDRKIVFHDSNAGPNEATKFDLYQPELDARPGVNDTTSELQAAYGLDGTNPFFEMSWPLVSTNQTEDVDISEKTHLKVLVNPYRDIYEVGHGAFGSNDLKLSYSPSTLFPRPEGPMDSLAIFFNAVFAIFVSFISLSFILGARNEKIAKKLWRVDVTEDMAARSIVMEIAFFNSSFLSLFSLFYFWIYSLSAVVYGLWANWGLVGLLINGIPLVIASITMVDLLLRNHNPQDVPMEDRKSFGKDVEKSGALWIIPPIFLGLVLFMLVFIGIDVIS